MSNPQRACVLGVGAIGRRVLGKLRDDLLPAAEIAVFDRPGAQAPGACTVFTSASELRAWSPDLVVECAGHGAVANVVPGILASGTDVILVSVGALSDPDLRLSLHAAAQEGRSRLITVSGAIGALDALSAARGAGLDEVRYVGRKPPAAWRGTHAEERVDLDTISSAVTFYTGNATGSARDFPQNANVTAAIALAGIGFEATQVRLIADPAIDRNIHELDVKGAFGRFHIRMENLPLPENPKTSWLAALSIEAEIRRYLGTRT
jgi:aspartate dehydrogenase